MKRNGDSEEQGAEKRSIFRSRGDSEQTQEEKPKRSRSKKKDEDDGDWGPTGLSAAEPETKAGKPSLKEADDDGWNTEEVAAAGATKKKPRSRKRKDDDWGSSEPSDEEKPKRKSSWRRKDDGEGPGSEDEEKPKRKFSLFGGGGDRPEEDEVDPVESLCKSIVTTFDNPESKNIGSDDYVKVLTFLLEHDRYDIVPSVDLYLDEARFSVLRCKPVKDRMVYLLSRRDTATLKDMMEQMDLSLALSSNNVDINDILVDHLKGVSKDVEKVVAEAKKVGEVLPDMPYYQKHMEDATLDVAVSYAIRDLGSCEDFATVDALYERYKTAYSPILASEKYGEAFTTKMSLVIHGFEDIEDLMPIRNKLAVPNRDSFLDRSYNIMIDVMNGLTVKYMTECKTVPEVNVSFNRAPIEIKENVAGSYFDRVDAIIAYENEMEALASDYSAIDWTYMHESGRKMKLVEDFCQSAIRMLGTKDSRDIPEFRFLTTNDETIATTMAQRILELCDTDGITHNSMYAWLEYFSKTPDSESIRRVKSKLCFEIGKSLMSTDAETALFYLGKAEYEDIGGLEVYGYLVLAEKRLADGDITLAIKYANDAMLKNDSMSCAGKAFMCYIKNLTDSPDGTMIRETIELYNQQSENLGDILVQSTLDSLALAYCAGNPTVGPASLWIGLRESASSCTAFFAAFTQCVLALEHYTYDNFSGMEEVLEDAAQRDPEGRMSNIIAIGRAVRAWQRGEITSGAAKSRCEEVLESTSWRLERWFALSVCGFIDELDSAWSYALGWYTKACDYIESRQALKIRMAEMAIRVNEYEAAVGYLEGNEDATSEIIRTEIDILSRKNIRSKNRLSKVKTRTARERAMANRVEGMSNFETGVLKSAVDKFTDAINEIRNSTRFRDVMLLVDLYRRRANTMYRIDEHNKPDANADYEAAYELLQPYGDTMRYIRDLRHTILAEKDAMNAARQAGPAVAEPQAAEVATFDLSGISIMITGQPHGSGGQFSVYRARGMLDSKNYAFRVPKQVNPYKTETFAMSKAEAEDMDRAEEIWSELTRECPDKVVQLIATSNNRFPQELMEFAESNYANRESGLSQRERMDAMVRMLECIQAIHDCGFVHNDIKPENLLEVNGVWKISDFDLSFEAGFPVENNKGTFQYMSPEQFGADEVTAKSDVWSAGVVVFHTLTNRFPFDGTGDEYRKGVLEGEYNEAMLSTKYIPLMDRVFSKDPSKRPTAGEFAHELENISDIRKEAGE